MSTDADKDFFISYTGADKKWADWIAWQLEEAQYSTILQAWDFQPGMDFVLEMDKATRVARCTIVVLSPDYLSARYTQPEWAVAFRRDPKSEQGALLPIRVQKCEVEGLLGPIIYIDLVDLDEATAHERLLVGVRHERGQPETEPGFPDSIRFPSHSAFLGLSHLSETFRTAAMSSSLGVKKCSTGFTSTLHWQKQPLRHNHRQLQA